MTPPPRDPLVEVAEKIATAVAIANPLGQRATEVILPILRAFVEEMEKAWKQKLRGEEERHAALQSRCYEGFPTATDGIFDALRRVDDDLAAARAEAEEERRLRATACKLADERLERLARRQGLEAKLAAMTEERDTFRERLVVQSRCAAEFARERDTARAEVADLKREVETHKAIALGGKLCISTQHDNLQAERDRAQERLREAEGLLAESILAIRKFSSRCICEGLPRCVSCKTDIVLIRRLERFHAFLVAHPDEQPAAPAGERCVHACAYKAERCIEDCIGGLHHVGGHGCVKHWTDVEDREAEARPPAPRTEAPASVRETAQRLGVTLTESREEIDRATAKRIAPEPSERHAFVGSLKGCGLTDGGHNSCGKPKSDPVHAQKDATGLWICDVCDEPHQPPHIPDPVHQAAEQEPRRLSREEIHAKVQRMGGAEALRRIQRFCDSIDDSDNAAPPDTRPDEREHVCTYECAGNYCEAPPMPTPTDEQSPLLRDIEAMIHRAHLGECRLCLAVIATAPSPSPSEAGKPRPVDYDQQERVIGILKARIKEQAALLEECRIIFMAQRGPQSKALVYSQREHILAKLDAHRRQENK